MFTKVRRSVFFFIVSLLLLPTQGLVIGKEPPGVPEDGGMTFRVTADGSPVGTEKYRFRGEDETLTVERTVKIDIDFLYVFVLRYRHRSVGTWRSESLMSLESSTDFRGSTYSVRLQRVNGNLVLREGREKGRAILADTTAVMPTTWWNSELRRAERLIDTQYGRLLDVDVEEVGSTRMSDIPGLEEATRFDISGDLRLSVWYGPDGQLVKLRYRRGGYTFVHRRSDY